MSKQRSQPPHSAAASPAKGDSRLSLEDGNGVPPAPQGRPAGGYDPYDVSPHALAAAARGVEPRSRAKDLRKLSEWIRLRHQVEALKQDEAPEKDRPASK